MYYDQHNTFGHIDQIELPNHLVMVRHQLMFAIGVVDHKCLKSALEYHFAVYSLFGLLVVMYLHLNLICSEMKMNAVDEEMKE